MKPFVAHALLLAFIVCSNGSQAFESHLSSSEEIKPWWQPLKSTLEPFESKPTILNPWWKHWKNRTKPSESKSTTLNPWWRLLRTTENTFRKRDGTTYPWWRHLRTTEKPFWKRDQTTYSWWRLLKRTGKPFLWQYYHDSYGHSRQNNQHTGHLSSLEELDTWLKLLRASKALTTEEEFLEREITTNAWWRPLRETEEPFGKTDHTLFSWWKPNREKATKPPKWKPSTSNPWWKFWKRTAKPTKPWWKPQEKTAKPWWKKDDDDWWRPARTTTAMPWWKRDHTPYPDSGGYSGTVSNANPVVIFCAIIIPAIVIGGLLYLYVETSIFRDCSARPDNTSSNFSSGRSRREIPSSRNSRAQQIFSVNSSANSALYNNRDSSRREAFASGTHERRSSDTYNTRDKPPDYSAVVLDDFVDGNKKFPTVKPTTPPPGYTDEFLPKY